MPFCDVTLTVHVFWEHLNLEWFSETANHVKSVTTTKEIGNNFAMEN